MSGALSILKAIAVATPTLCRLFEQLAAWIVEQRIEHMASENREAVRRAIQEFDQREVEHVIGSPTAGKPSGLPGTVIVDSPPPGVKLPK